MPTELISRAQAWLADDPDDATRDELRAVIDAAATGVPEALEDLADRFRGTLEFGTAGLRGRIGAGPNRMNRAVVIRAAAGLARYMTDALAAEGVEGPGRVAIGYDARHGSREFALDTAAVMTAAGHEALLLPRTLPTPVLAFATRFLDADAGVMVTASHNPPQDNGYKVYLGGRIVGDEGQGAQIVPPYDAEIAAHIAAVPSVASVERADEGWTVLGEGVIDEYVAQVAALVPAAGAQDGEAGSSAGEVDSSAGEVDSSADAEATEAEAVAARRAATRIVLTPLHGVGGETVERALRAAGFTDLHTVPEQAQPDPDFPTVDFPNPEEKGAIDLSLELARSVRADVVIANDPDADRCAVATVVDGAWTMLHGDVVGSLLGERVAERCAADRVPNQVQVLANSIVSSQQLAAIAARHGLSHANTLTGFKWIGRAKDLVFGYEEALGYCVAPQLVRDKDGISAALLLADFVAELKEAGRTLADAIDDLAREYGVYLTSQVSARYADLALIPETMNRLMSAPPETLAGSPVVATDDMSQGFRGLPGTTGLHLAAESGARVIVRPSGTEPKVKAYLEVIVPVEGDVYEARLEATATMAALRKDVERALGI